MAADLMWLNDCLFVNRRWSRGGQQGILSGITKKSDGQLGIFQRNGVQSQTCDVWRRIDSKHNGRDGQLEMDNREERRASNGAGGMGWKALTIARHQSGNTQMREAFF
jgi:hypothetical protein